MEARSNVRRTRVCKRCKFSTSDAREFLHHQIRDHSESVEVHQCDKCEFVTAVYSELVSHKRIHRKSSTRHFSEGSEPGLIDDANNNEKPDESLDPPPYPRSTSPDLQITDSASPIPSVGSPETPQSINAIATRNYTCNQCGFKCTSSKTNLRHMVEDHNAVFDIFECDLCDYATRYKHKLPRHRECHFNNNNQRPYPKMATSPPSAPSHPSNAPVFPDHEHIERDENSNQTKLPNSVSDKYAALTHRLNAPTSKGAESKAINHMSGGQLVSTTPKMTSPGVMAVKNRLSSGMSGTPSQVTAKARSTCTPVREAVDPAKYVTIREPDGVKYACSKCGNIYKWRKSLNKHWKEKHDGEIPDPRPNFTELSIPQIQAKAAANKMKHGVHSTSALMNQFPPGLLTSSGMNPMMPPSKGPKTQGYNSPTLSQVLKRPPMLGHNVPGDMSKRYLSPFQPIGAERASPEVRSAEFAERDIHRNIYGEMKPDVLDLSRKPNGQILKNPVAMETSMEPPQDQPLDFSKKSARAEAPMQNINKENDFTFKKYSDFPHTPIVPEQTASLSLQCPSCAYLGRDKQDYDNHMELHLRKRHYKCAECQQVFFTIGELNSHFLDNHSEVLHSKSVISGLGADGERPQLLKYLTDSSKQLLSCVVCGAIFQWQWTLAKHFVQDHPTLPNPYSKRPREGANSAESERKRFKGSEAAGRRSSADPLEEVLPFSGTGDITAENTAIVIPQAPEDTQKVSPASSTSSSSKGRGKGVKDYQMRDFEGLPFKCKFCEYKARWPSEITQHMKNHSDEKPYLCPRCSYRSKWKWDVVKHLKRCGGGTVKDVIDTTKVQDCDKMQASRNVLSNGPPNVTVIAHDSHMKLPTETQKVEDGSAILQPDSCDSSTEHIDASTTLALMESKIPEMTGETENGGIPGQMYYCPHCPFIGHSQAELKRHTRVHSDAKPFICKTCGYSSKWKCDLKKHLRTYKHTSAVPLIYGGHGRKPTDLSEDEKMEKTSDEDTPEGMQDIHQCSKCNFVTPHADFLAEHKKVHMQRKTALSAKLTCKKCSFEATDLPTFLQHKLQHNQNGEAASTGSRDSGPEDQPQKHRRKASKQFRVVHSAVDNFDSSEEAGSGYDEASYLASSYGSYADSEGEPQDLSVKRYHCSWCNWSTTNLNVLHSHAKVMHSQVSGGKQRTESVGSSGSEEKFKFAESLDLRPINMQHSPASVSSARLDDEPIGSPAPVSPMMVMTAMKKDTRRKRKLKPCPRCDYVTDNMTTLQRHLSKHGGNGKFTCRMCDYSVDRQHILDYHVKNVHNGVLPAEVLPSSTKVFQKIADPYAGDTEEADDEEVSISFVKGQEVKSIRRGSKVTYGCTKCPFESINITNTYNHSRQHGLAKRYRCPACDYSQDHSRHVLNHMKTIHALDSGLVDASPSTKPPRPLIQKPTKLVCRKCPFSTLNHTRYLIHRKSHNITKYSCNKCAHKSLTALLLAQHKAKIHA